MDYACEITHQAAQPTLSIRVRTPVQNLPAQMGRCFGAIAGYLGSLGQAPAEPVYSAYYNMDMSDLDVEIGMCAAAPVPGRGEIAAGWLPEGDVASTLHVGPYAEMRPAYAALDAFIKQSGRQPAGAAYEYYLNDPNVAGEEPRTRIVFPLA